MSRLPLSVAFLLQHQLHNFIPKVNSRLRQHCGSVWRIKVCVFSVFNWENVSDILPATDDDPQNLGEESNDDGSLEASSDVLNYPLEDPNDPIADVDASDEAADSDFFSDFYSDEEWDELNGVPTDEQPPRDPFGMQIMDEKRLDPVP
jgi:hypothetical protein